MKTNGRNTVRTGPGDVVFQVPGSTGRSVVELVIDGTEFSSPICVADGEEIAIRRVAGRVTVTMNAVS